MSTSKVCCANWLAMVSGIQTAKLKELSDVKPEYLAIPVKDVVRLINNYCPVCGESLTEKKKVVSHKPNKEVPSQETSHDTGLIVCPACKGEEQTGEGGMPLMCNTCFGERKVKKPNKVSPEKLAKLDDLRNKLRSKQKE